MAAGRITFDDLIQTVRDFCRGNYPGDDPDEFALKFRSGRRLEVPVPAAETACRVRHSPDFHWLSWHGTEYRLGGAQAAAFRLLWESHQAGVPVVAGEVLLEAAESESRAARDIFKKHPLWEDGVVGSAGKGALRLFTPDELDGGPTAEPSQQKGRENGHGGRRIPQDG